MNWNAILGVACVISFTLPVVVILYNRYYTHRSLLALLIYYSLILIDNLLGEGIIPSTRQLQLVVGFLDNYLDTALMLTALLFFCPSREKQHKIRLLTLTFLVYEVAIICIQGFTRTSIILISGPGVGIILLYSFYLFLKQVKFSIYHGKNHGRVAMLASIFFGYACYVLIYFFHYIQRTPFEADVFKLYYISSMVSSVLMAVGLHMMRVRMKELESLKTTRRELALFFGH